MAFSAPLPSEADAPNLLLSLQGCLGALGKSFGDGPGEGVGPIALSNPSDCPPLMSDIR